ncbi:MAG: hypothetical protein H6551_03010 [Chitinophagales bacterium]|nr:hypothetical protein [Chitinophagaceae bacterium]MCB9064094.1 hypothetical protein [Chitinophagales bacterium]
MLLLPNLLNEHKLFQVFNGLEVNSEAFSDFKESVLNHGTDAILRMERIRSVNNGAIKEFELFEDQLNLQDERVVFSSQSVGVILNEISPLLSTIRILQNKLCSFVSKWESVSLPQSINDFMKKPDVYEINATVRKMLVKYWEEHGKYAKFYRDIDQHDYGKSELTSRYFMQVIPEKIVFVEVPDFQDSINRASFTYNNKTNIIVFLDEACYELHEVYENIAKEYGANPTQHQDSTRLAQLGDLLPARERTLALMYQTKIIKSEKGNAMDISAIKIDQNTEAKLVLQNCRLNSEKIKEANNMYGIKKE